MSSGADLLPVEGAPGGVLLPEDQQDALLDALDAAAAQYLADNARPNTRRAYADDWRVWTGFCEYLGVAATTARYGLWVAFVEYLVRMQAAPTTIDRRLSGVAVTLAERGCDVPRRVTRAARSALSIYKRDLAAKGVTRGRGQAVPIRIKHLKVICSYLDSVLTSPTATERERLLAKRDKALLLLGFGLAARRSELSALHAADVVPSDEGLLVTIRSSKSSDDAATVPILAGASKSTCPLRAWLAYDVAVSEHVEPRGRAFIELDGRSPMQIRVIPQLSGHDINALIMRLDRDSGLDAGLTGHSLRAGLATEARQAGHDVKTIATQGRWSPQSTAVWRYIRIVDQWQDNATAGIGL